MSTIAVSTAAGNGLTFSSSRTSILIMWAVVVCKRAYHQVRVKINRTRAGRSSAPSNTNSDKK